MNIPEKYRELKCKGNDPYLLAKALISDGYGKLRVITVLRKLFILSLNDANEVYEITTHKGSTS